MNSKWHHERGSAILITLALIILFSGLALTSMNTAVTNVNTSFNQIRAEKSILIAQAGLERTLTQLKTTPTWRTGFVNVPLGDGAYSVAVLDSSSGLTKGDTLILRSAGVVREASKALELWVAPERDRPFQYALFTKNNIDMWDSACTDSYRSDSGTYAATQADKYGDVGSNGQVRISDFVSVGGDVAATRPSDLYLDSTVNVSGDIIKNLPTQNIDIVPPAEFTWAKANNRAPSGLSGSGYTYNAVTGKLTVGSNKTVTLSNGVYHFSKIQISDHGKFLIAPGAKVTVYVTGDVELAQYGAMNPGGAPSALALFSQGSTLQLDDYSEFRGAVIGPNMQLQLTDKVQVYGAAMMGQVSISNSGCFHYDRALMDYARGYTGRWEKIAWREL